jgi:hypothetical protein
MNKYLIIPLSDSLRELMFLCRMEWFHSNIPANRYKQELANDFIIKYLELFHYYIKNPVDIEFSIIVDRRMSSLFNRIGKYLIDFEDDIKFVNAYFNNEIEFKELLLKSLNEFKDNLVLAIHNNDNTKEETFINFFSSFIAKGLSIIEIHSFNNLELIIRLKD